MNERTKERSDGKATDTQRTRSEESMDIGMILRAKKPCKGNKGHKHKHEPACFPVAGGGQAKRANKTPQPGKADEHSRQQVSAFAEGSEYAFQNICVTESDLSCAGGAALADLGKQIGPEPWVAAKYPCNAPFARPHTKVACTPADSA